jgi:MoxR-like ATPase
MTQIVGVHHPALADSLLQQALERFYELRSIEILRKKPSTSELIDWLQALIAAGVTVDQLEDKLPFLGVLMKKETDIDTYMKRATAGVNTPRPRY